LAHQFASTKAKAEAELAQAREEIRQATERQAADVRLAALELQNTQYEEARARQLAPRDDLRKATARVRDAQERVEKARLPVDTGRVEVVRWALTLTEKDYAVRQQELDTKRSLKQADVAALRIELANLELERRQTVMRAPIDGIVTAGDIKVGDFLERGNSWWRSRNSRGSASRLGCPVRTWASCRSACPPGSSSMHMTTNATAPSPGPWFSSPRTQAQETGINPPPTWSRWRSRRLNWGVGSSAGR
jgi:multidrug efflux pump subunit AcrA (membrane-fusion protein)